MTHPLIRAVIQNYRLNLRLAHKQLDGLSHPDSLLQLPFQGNCLNWVVGHVIQGRSELLELLGKPPIWGQPEAAVYQTGSEPITPQNAGVALPLEELLKLLEESQTRIEQTLQGLSADVLEKTIEQDGHPSTLGEMVNGYNWHETYHIGQMELLHQLAVNHNSVI